MKSRSFLDSADIAYSDNSVKAAKGDTCLKDGKGSKGEITKDYDGCTTLIRFSNVFS